MVTLPITISGFRPVEYCIRVKLFQENIPNTNTMGYFFVSQDKGWTFLEDLGF